MDWDDALRRIQAGEKLLDVVEEQSAADRQRFRSFLADMGPRGVAALQRYDAAMRDLDTGVMGARGTWHALSAAQRRILSLLGGGGRLWRSHASRYAVRGGTVPNACGIATVRNLAARELVAWDGGAFDPEAAAVITERGTFVLAHGPSGG